MGASEASEAEEIVIKSLLDSIVRTLMKSRRIRILIGFLSDTYRILIGFLSDSYRILVGFLSDSHILIGFLSDS